MSIDSGGDSFCVVVGGGCCCGDTNSATRRAIKRTRVSQVKLVEHCNDSRQQATRDDDNSPVRSF